MSTFLIILKWIPWVLSGLGIINGLIAGKRIKNFKEDIEAEKKKTAEAEFKKAKLVKSVDNILMFQSDDDKTKKQTEKNVEILRKTGSKTNVKKEMAILRDSIFANYNQLRND